MRAASAALVLAALLGGCGTKELNHDVRGFTQQSDTPAGQAVLRSIATYRMTEDEALACRLITRHFLDTPRFDGKVENCEQVVRAASRHLPDSASIQSLSGSAARVLVDEPTATKSVYVMKRERGTWKIDDIVEAR